MTEIGRREVLKAAAVAPLGASLDPNRYEPQRLVALRVRIGLRQDGKGALYPPFNELPCVQAAGIDWAYYVDTAGRGWCYDKVCGHRQARSGSGWDDSPRGKQWGVLLVPSQFAREACSMLDRSFDLAVIPESMFENFHDTRAMAHLPDIEVDETVIRGLEALTSAGVELTDEQKRAFDPDDPCPGLRRCRKKVWRLRKEDEGIVLG